MPAAMTEFAGHPGERHWKLENVLERLGITENITITITITIKREEGGKIRVTSLLWEAPKVLLRRGAAAKSLTSDFHVTVDALSHFRSMFKASGASGFRRGGIDDADNVPVARSVGAATS
jgi:hypothetical protein